MTDPQSVVDPPGEPLTVTFGQEPDGFTVASARVEHQLLVGPVRSSESPFSHNSAAEVAR